MVSYQWTDFEAAELLHEELALRGINVFHDRCTFPTGSRIGENMGYAVDVCDGFLAYLTPHSLYEDSEPGSPRPAIDYEFKPAMDRLARSKADGVSPGRPVIIPLVHGLGDPRTEASDRVRKATGKDISTLWTPVVLDQQTAAISQTEASVVGNYLLTALLPPGGEDHSLGSVEVVVTTRGAGQPGGFLTVDGTSLLGGDEHRPGSLEEWRRYLAGIRDLQSALARWTTLRDLKVRMRSHLSAAIAFGRVFNQAVGWRLQIEGRQGAVTVAERNGHRDLSTSLDKGSAGADLSIEIDLLNVKVGNLASGVLSALESPVKNRLSVWREDSTIDLHPADVSAMALTTSNAVRSAIFDIRPARVHIFCASPIEFACLLGSTLTSLHTDLHLYERDGNCYVASIVLPSSI
jgi:hypothetical protein